MQTEQLESLPPAIAHLTESIAALQAQKAANEGALSDDPDLRLSLAATRERLQERAQEEQRLDLEIERLQASLPAKAAEVQRLQDELTPIQLRKVKAVEEAQEAKRRREQGGMADELAERGRWLRGVEASLKSMLEV